MPATRKTARGRPPPDDEDREKSKDIIEPEAPPAPNPAHLRSPEKVEFRFDHSVVSRLSMYVIVILSTKE